MFFNNTTGVNSIPPGPTNRPIEYSASNNQYTLPELNTLTERDKNEKITAGVFDMGKATKALFKKGSVAKGMAMGLATIIAGFAKAICTVLGTASIILAYAAAMTAPFLLPPLLLGAGALALTTGMFAVGVPLYVMVTALCFAAGLSPTDASALAAQNTFKGPWSQMKDQMSTDSPKKTSS